MGDISYRPLIEPMKWSYSRIGAFEQCPYRWYMKYINVPKLYGKDMFFASYGSFIHGILENFYDDRVGEKITEVSEIEKQILLEDYLKGFASNVKGAPNQNIFRKYFNAGKEYFKNFKPIPYKILAVEKKVEFNIGSIEFQGYIDLLAEDDDGELVIIDHKSRDLKKRSGRKNPTKSDETLDKYLRQLYLYAIAVKNEYGKYPKLLCFNCFKAGEFIEEPFDESKISESVEWITKSVNEICDETNFDPEVEYWQCNHLCEMQDHCCYFELSKRK